MEQVSTFLEDVDTDLLLSYAIEYGTALIGAVLVFVFGKILAKAITRVIRKLMEKNNIDPTITSFLSNIAYALLFAVVIIATISTLGIETTSLAAIIAAAGLAIGLALQGSLSNFASGVLVIMFRPFKIGDYIEAAGTAGTVEEISIFTTHLKTPDNCAIVVPNGAITSGSIKNYSAKATRRIDLVVGVGYDDDLAKVKSVLEDIIASEERVLKDPETTIAVSELADSSVNLVVRPWVQAPDYWAVKFDLTEAIKNRFDKEGISIPYPQQDLHIIKGGADQLKAA